MEINTTILLSLGCVFIGYIGYCMGLGILYVIAIQKGRARIWKNFSSYPRWSDNAFRHLMLLARYGVVLGIILLAIIALPIVMVIPIALGSLIALWRPIGLTLPFFFFDLWFPEQRSKAASASNSAAAVPMHSPSATQSPSVAPSLPKANPSAMKPSAPNLKATNKNQSWQDKLNS